jgi:hypothetical protein
MHGAKTCFDEPNFSISRSSSDDYDWRMNEKTCDKSRPHLHVEARPSREQRWLQDSKVVDSSSAPKTLSPNKSRHEKHEQAWVAGCKTVESSRRKDYRFPGKRVGYY